MRSRGEYYRIEAAVTAHFPGLRSAQGRGLALWVYGTILAQSGCQTAVITALRALGGWETLRQYLREWTYDGADRAAPCRTELEVAACFAPLLSWLLGWWRASHLPLAIDATLHGDRLAVVAVSVLYRGCAIPVAWHVLPANRPGAWLPPLVDLLRRLGPAVPPGLTVLVLADRGLWSPRVWGAVRELGWHPLLRLKGTTTFRPAGQRRRRPARALIPGPGHAWVGRGVAFKHAPARRAATLVVLWDRGQAEPWVLLTDLPPEAVGVCWYGLRVWIELGFRALKGLGWQWQRTRRTDPTRAARHWLVLAVATLWVLAYGTRVEDADLRGVPPAHLRTPPPAPLPRPRPRPVSVFRQGLAWLARHLLQRRLWRRLWLLPEPWPAPPPTLTITIHEPT